MPFKTHLTNPIINNIKEANWDKKYNPIGLQFSKLILKCVFA